MTRATIGQRLRELRKKNGQTLKEAAHQAEISFTYLSDVERGRSDPSLKTLEKLAKVYKITLPALFIEPGQCDQCYLPLDQHHPLCPKNISSGSTGINSGGGVKK